MKPFVHLHLHTEYSLLDGAAKIDNLFNECKKNNMPAVAITDHGVMYGAYKFYKAALANDIKPIIGCEFYMCNDMYDKSTKVELEHLVLLAKNQTGYKNLVKLDSLAFVDGYYYKPRIDYKTLEKYSEGVICLSACLSGAIPKLILKGDLEGAEEKAKWFQKLFPDGDFYLEIQDHNIPEQKVVNNEVIKIARKLGIKLVATNDVHYIKKEDSEMQDVLLCIQTGKTYDDPKRMRFDGSEFYLKNYDEMYELFSYVEEALETPFEIVEKCNVSFKKEKLLPLYTPPGGMDSAAYLKQLLEEGLKKRYDVITPEIRERADYEYSIICNMGFVDYFLIVWDFINYAKEHGIPVGAGRGSGAGSIVAYAIRITDIDPIRFNLIFERFLNPERVSMPDFDIDFCYEGRGRVIEYVIEKYGKDNVSQIVTFGTMAAKGAIKDVGRVYGVPYAETDKVSKLLPQKGFIWQFLGLPNPSGAAPKDGDDQSIPDLIDIYNSNKEMKRVIDMAIKIQNMPRNTSMHAAGVVICRDPISDHVPLQRNGEEITTQFNMIEVEELGLLKMDFLGLRTLTDVSKALKYVKETTGDVVDFYKIGYDDKGTYELISEGKTDAVFQLESAGMKKFMRDLKPDNIEEIVVGISLYRPGPMDSIPTYIKNKEHPEDIVYPHPILEKILGITHNCMVYQEQVMQIVQQIAGFTLGEADEVRRAMSKKKKDKMAEYGEYFINGRKADGKHKEIEGAIKRGVSEQVARDLFSQMEKFASYAFNKSHAACYAVLSYQTAYLKRYYPVQFTTAILNNRIDKIDEITKYVSQLRMENIEVLKPDINLSKTEFSVENGAVRFGLAAIKNVGYSAIDTIIKERENNGDFASLKDFIKRVEPSLLNKRMVENLIKAGAFDCFGIERSRQIAVYEQLMDRLQKDKKKKASGQFSMFDMFDDTDDDFDKVEYPDLPEYDSKTKLAFEKDVLGVYVSGHPLQDFADSFYQFSFNTSMLDEESEEEIEDEEMEEELTETSSIKDGDSVFLGGIITSFTKKVTKSNTEMAFAMLEDLYGEIELVFFPKDYSFLKKKMQQGFLPELTAGVMVKAYGRIMKRENEKVKVQVNKLTVWNDEKEEVKEIKQEEKVKYKLFLNLEDKTEEEVKSVKAILCNYPGDYVVIAKINGKPYRFSMKVNKVPGLESELLTILNANEIVFKKE